MQIKRCNAYETRQALNFGHIQVEIVLKYFGHKFQLH